MFRTSPAAKKTAAETAKETLESVNRTVSDAAVKGIEKGGMFYTMLSLGYTGIQRFDASLGISNGINNLELVIVDPRLLTP